MVILYSDVRYGPGNLLLWAVVFAIMSCALPSVTEADTRKAEAHQDSLENKAVEAWLYFYPLLVMQASQLASDQAPSNTWQHSDVTRPNEFAAGGKPNADTVYSRAWLDLRDGPINLHVPDMGERYYVIQGIDQWSQTFATTGSRATGNKAGTIVYLPPGMRKEQYISGHWPIGATFVECPDYRILLLAQMQRGGPEQAKRIAGLQSKFLLRRHAETFQSHENRRDTPSIDVPEALLASLAAGVTPSKAVLQLSPADFFSWATALWGSASVTLSASDREFAKDIIQLGFYPGRAIRWQELTERRQQMLTAAAHKARKLLDADSVTLASTVHNGWHYPKRNWYAVDGHKVSITQSDNYVLRARLASTGLDYLPPAELIVLTASHQAMDGNVLNGGQGQQYVIQFEANKLPPVEAFWSLYVTTMQGQQANNLLGRSHLGSDDELLVDADGRVTIFLSAGNPYGDRSSNTANWLPIPAQDFRVELRAYQPGPTFGSNPSWRMPAIRKQTSPR